MLHTNFQQNKPSALGKKVDFIGFAIFSITGHLEIWTRPNFTILKPCSQIMLHVKFENVGCSGGTE